MLKTIKNILTTLTLMQITHLSIADELGIQFYVDSTVVRSATDAQQEVWKEDLAIWVDEVADFYKDSDIDLQPKIVRVVFGDFDGGSTDSSTLKNRMAKETGNFENLFDLADEFGADYTIAIFGDITKDGDTLCGSASGIGSNKSKITSLKLSYAIMTDSLSCQATTLAHELGHLQGLVHGDYVDTLTGNHIYGRLNNDNRAKGWGEGNANGILEANEFGTIMVGNYQFNKDLEGGSRLAPVFSNPKITHINCGQNIKGENEDCGDATNGNASAILNENIENYTSHAEPDVHTVKYSSSELSACIRSAYPIRENSNYNDIDEVTTINCQNKDIGSLAGLEEITALHTSSNVNVNFSKNRIVSLQPLMKLHKSATINLTGNNVASCHQLDELENTHINLQRPERCLNVAAIIVAVNFIL